MENCLKDVLVVDDEPTLVYITGTILRKSGYEVDTATDCDVAQEFLSENRYRVMLTDVHMPKMTGIQLARYARELNENMQTLILTGSPSVRDAVDGMKAGAVDYLVKPLKKGELLERIGVAVRAHQDFEATATGGGGATVPVARKNQTRLNIIAGEFRMLRTLGRGSAGIVLLVEKDGDKYAMKQLKLWEAGGLPETQLKRFAREGMILEQLDHPNIVKIHDIVLEEKRGGPYILMEYVEGSDLKSLIVEGNMDFDTRCHLFRQILRGADAVHKHGVVHRDLKPHNILVDRSMVAKLTDFGVARVNAEATLTEVGYMLGSPAYMAPEMFRGQRADQASDIFSMGVLAFELFAGKRPFNGETVAQISHFILSEPTPELTEIAPDVPLEVGLLVTRMLEKDASMRHPSFRVILDEFNALLGSGR